MSNVLILHNSLNCNKTGVDRVSSLLKKELQNRGYNCFEGCVYGENINHQQDVFEYNFNESRVNVSKQILEYTIKYNINVIIIQGFVGVNINYAIRLLKKQCDCKIIFCLHNDPSTYRREIPLSLLNRIKNLVWYFVKFQIIIFDYRNYRLKMLDEMYNIADKFVLLSRNYLDGLSKTIRVHDLNKIVFIGNPLTFQTPLVDFKKKKKQVLILCRLEEFYKNISSALRIWKLIENTADCDWNLSIVGSGDDEKKLKDYAATLNLKTVAFLGETSKPEKYYQESALFMMTSYSEGWPMALLEAQQYGCVPLAFDTFAALSEIIENGVNGYIVEKNDEMQFAKKIIELMKNRPLRQQLAQNCINISRHYSSKAIGDKWDSLLHHI